MPLLASLKSKVAFSKFFAQSRLLSRNDNARVMKTNAGVLSGAGQTDVDVSENKQPCGG